MLTLSKADRAVRQPQPKMALVSVVLPVRNQADHIAWVVRQHHEHLLQLPVEFELLLVPNGCSDESELICQNLSAQLPGVRTVIGSGPGWGRAVNTGLNHANGDLMCYASSARISSADLLKHIQFALGSPNSVVKAQRLSQDSGFRTAGSALYNWLCRSLFGLSTRDVNGTPKSFPKTFSKLLELSEDGYLVDVEFNVVCKKNDYPVVELPIEHTERHGGTSTTTVSTALNLFVALFGYWNKVRKQAT
ncbi:MAG: glycosyltransferase [Cyanobacteria bacterium SZAS-4]|nr:glycosyltransferase [Cyanobacteria bacterium SZAS-4]